MTKNKDIPEKYRPLQQEYEEAYAASGVTLKEFVESKGLNFNTLRRYLKAVKAGGEAAKQKSAAGKKSAEMRTARKEMRSKAGLEIKSAHLLKSAQFWFDKLEKDKRFSRQQREFSFHFFKGLSVNDAAALAGYKDPRPCYRLIATDHFAEYRQEFRLLRFFDPINECAKQLELITQMLQFDVNELCSNVVCCCRGCWAKDGVYQYMSREEKAYRLEEWEAENAGKEENDPRRTRKPRDVDDFDFDPMRAPNPRCFMCLGFGQTRQIFHDTRNLTGVARLMYDGVSRGKDGIRIHKPSKEYLLKLLSHYLGPLGVHQLQRQEKELAHLDTRESREQEMHFARLEEVRARTTRHNQVKGGGTITVQLLNAFAPPGAAAPGSVDGQPPTPEELELYEKRKNIDEEFRAELKRKAEGKEKPELDGKRKQ